MEDDTEVNEKKENVGKQVEKLRVFQNSAAQLFMEDTPNIYKLDKTRKRGFVAHKEPNTAVNVRHQSGLIRESFYDESDYRRTGYFRSSMQRDPGPISKFGDGDGSYFDRFLTNTRFHHADEKFCYMRGDLKETKSHQVPHIGMKQWLMPEPELRFLEQQRQRSFLNPSSSHASDG